MNFRRAVPLAALFIALAGAPVRADIEQQHARPAEPPPAPAPPELTKPPALTKKVDPVYPELAQQELRGGDVILLVTIDAAGRVSDVKVQASSGSADIDVAAVDAARLLEFSPAEWDGVPGPVALEYKMTFAPQVEPPPPPPPLPEGAPPPPRPINVVGLVRAAITKDALEAVEISVELPGGEDPVVTSVSDGAGHFALAGVPLGPQRLSFTFSGYEASFVDIDVEDGVRVELIVTLQPRDSNGFETVVRRRRAQTEVARVVLSREELRRVPGTFGDPLRVIESLPGLARAGFAGGQLIVRGANPEDTGVYYDGVQIPLLYHFQGLKSVINAEFLDDISFYPGGFGAYYGRATAGIVDISSRTLDVAAPRGAVDVNLFDAGFFVAAPVNLGELPTFTFAAAARRSYIDAFLPFIIDAVTPPGGQAIVVAPVYWDYQLKLETSLSSEHTFSLFTFGSDDNLSISASGLGDNSSLSIGSDTQFHRLVGRWTWRINDSAKNIFQPFIGTTSQGLSLGTGESTFGGDNGVTSFGLRDDLQWKLTDTLTLKTGFDGFGELTSTDFDVPAIKSDINGFPRAAQGLGNPDDLLDGDTQAVTSEEVRLAAAVYVEAQLEPIPGLHLIPGLRGELTHVDIGAAVQADGTSIAGAVIDQWTLDPRFTVRWDLMPWTTLKAAAGVYRQAPTNTQLSARSGNPDLEQQRAVQLIVGVEQRLTDLISVDLQAYSTDRDLLARDLGGGGGLGGAIGGGGIGGGGAPGGGGGGGGVSTSSEPPSDNGGTGRTVGLEVLLRHDISEHFYGWVAYTLSQTLENTDADLDRLVLTANDQTHILTVVGQTTLPWGFSLGARFRLVSGNPTTLPAGSKHDLDTTSYQALASASGGERLPTFHQLDVRVDRKWVFDAFSLTTYVDVLNLYYAQNAEGFISDYRSRELQPLPSLPIVPIIGLSGEF
ncbi:MAG: TonB-dependent receptor [Deltaproteobacteria bacterium]|nr:TonB-dependent receptor [Deltaproteobacteria bacterium]